MEATQLMIDSLNELSKKTISGKLTWTSISNDYEVIFKHKNTTITMSKDDIQKNSQRKVSEYKSAEINIHISTFWYSQSYLVEEKDEEYVPLLLLIENIMNAVMKKKERNYYEFVQAFKKNFDDCVNTKWLKW